MENNMKNPSYENLKEEEELEQLKGKLCSLEDRVSEIMKEILQELEIKKPKQKSKKIKKDLIAK